MNKLKSYVLANWLGLVKAGVVMAIFALTASVGYQAFWVYQEKGKELGKIELASVEEIPAFDGNDKLKNARTVVGWFAPPQDGGRSGYDWSNPSLYDYLEFKSRNLVYQKTMAKAALETDTGAYESYYWGRDFLEERDKLQSYLASFTARVEQLYGAEAVAKAWQDRVESDSKVITGESYRTKAVKANWSTVWQSGFMALALAIFLVGVYNVLKLKSEGMRIWCEVANFRLQFVSVLFPLTLVVDAYPLHSAVDQLRTVRRTCSMLLSLLIPLGAAMAGKAQTNSGSGSGNQGSGTPYALVIEARPSVALNGDAPKREVSFRAMVTSPDDEFVENVASYRNKRFTNLLIAGKWFKVNMSEKFGKLKIGAYGGWRFTDAPNAAREDSIVGGAKFNYAKPLTSDKNTAFNVFAPVAQVERSIQKNKLTFATVVQTYFSFKKQGVNIGSEFSYRKPEGQPYTGYFGPIFAKRLAGDSKGVLKSLFGEIGLFKDLPRGDWRIRGRMTFSF